MGIAGDSTTDLRSNSSPICHQVHDQSRNSVWRARAVTVVLHAVYVGALFMDYPLRRMLREKPWYMGSYLAVLVATLAQYFFTSGSSPGYVTDTMRAENGTRTTFIESPSVSQQSLSKKGISDSPKAQNLLGRSNSIAGSSTWMTLITELYPPGSTSRDWTCHVCKIIQPPRAKHCVDCGKCILEFDHHCVWLGTCVGQKNHCRFWWYIFAQTILCAWTAILYITFLRSGIEKAWWKDFVMIILLASLLCCLIFLLMLLLFHSYLALTNQTSYEIVRRKRISYFRGVPAGVHPFSKGICRNLRKYCCSFDNVYAMEAVPSPEEIEALARPYTCIDIALCHCC